ncbi:OmpH family outer membrane protein [Arcicella aquatica]|uniref:OmpH family outer membrane protein n=1 Tax=Arcicella aquatica TaxID=217141 RepID=A0ABU5QK46_9BACT|nr:OmpH family outer membrane protein [Arcicella aquatica]MEA5257408.1 OmpH family outer membrane protein [Arcicella aquatica]
MKKRIFLLILPFLCLCSSIEAQKFGYIDTEYVTSKLPEYQSAQAEIEKLTTKWIKEVSTKNDELAKLEKAYRAEEVLLTEEMKVQRLKVIADKEKEAKELQNRIFGFDGELIKKKQDIMKPVLDEVAKAVEKVARLKKLDFLFDKSSDGLAMLYTNPIHDYTDYVMEELGISTEQLKEKQEQEAKQQGEENKESDNTTKSKSTRKGVTSNFKKE